MSGNTEKNNTKENKTGLQSEIINPDKKNPKAI